MLRRFRATLPENHVKDVCFVAPDLYLMGRLIEHRSFTHATGSRRAPAGRDEKGTPVIPFWIFDWGFRISQSPVQNRQSKIGRVWGCPRNCESNDGCVPETVRHSPIELCQMRSARLIAGGRGTVERVRLPVGRGLFAGVHGFDEPGDLPVCVPRGRPRRPRSLPKASGTRGVRRAWLHRLPVLGEVPLPSPTSFALGPFRVRTRSRRPSLVRGEGFSYGCSVSRTHIRTSSRGPAGAYRLGAGQRRRSARPIRLGPCRLGRRPHSPAGLAAAHAGSIAARNGGGLLAPSLVAPHGRHED